LKAEHIKLIIDGAVQVFMWGLTVFGLVEASRIFFKERSVGKAALIKLGEEHAAIKREVEELKKEHGELSDEIVGIQSKYEKLIEKMLQNFPFKN
jgi:hypothetical protein